MSIISGLNSGVGGGGGGGGGPVSTGTTINGAQILEANLGATGPWSTEGILNMGVASGVILAMRNYINSSDVALIRSDGADDVYFGASGDNVINVSLVGANGNALQIQPGGAQFNSTRLNLLSTPINADGSSPITVATGAYVAMQGNGPVASTGELRFSATGTLIAARRADNGGDSNILSMDGNYDLTVGDATNLTSLNLRGGQVSISDSGGADSITVGSSAISISASHSVSVLGPTGLSIQIGASTPCVQFGATGGTIFFSNSLSTPPAKAPPGLGGYFFVTGGFPYWQGPTGFASIMISQGGSAGLI